MPGPKTGDPALRITPVQESPGRVNANNTHMGRAKAILQSEFPYNISSRCINREWFNIPLEKVWNVFCEEIYMTVITHNLKVHSFVLMNNHFHMIVSTPDANISQCMHRLMGQVSRRLNELGNRINGNFAGRHFKTVLQHQNYYLNAYKYNYRNPVAVGLSQRAEDYPYSTLSGLLGKRKLLIPLAEDSTLFSDVSGTLEWLNERPTDKNIEAIRWGLKRGVFKSQKNRSGRLIMAEDAVL